MESGRYILFEGTYRFLKYMVSFDKQTGERSINHKGKGVEVIDNFWGPANDIDGGFSGLMQYDENMWWATYDAYDMAERLTPEHFESVRRSVKYPDRLEKLQTFVSTLKESDNPVFVIAKLKK